MAQYTVDNLPYPIDFSCNGDALARTLQNCKNLLMLRMGEVPYDRYRGFDPALFDMTVPEMNEALLPELDRILMWEPDAEVVSAKAEITRANGCVITMVVEIDL